MSPKSPSFPTAAKLSLATYSWEEAENFPQHPFIKKSVGRARRRRREEETFSLTASCDIGLPHLEDRERETAAAEDGSSLLILFPLPLYAPYTVARGKKMN